MDGPAFRPGGALTAAVLPVWPPSLILFQFRLFLHLLDSVSEVRKKREIPTLSLTRSSAQHCDRFPNLPGASEA